jgi:hypothetical protein
MEKGLMIFINKIFRNDLNFLYGDGTHVEIQKIIFSTNKKIYVISCKLYVGNLEQYEQIGETGINYLFEEAWTYMGFGKESFMLQVSFDLT